MTCRRLRVWSVRQWDRAVLTVGAALVAGFAVLVVVHDVAWAKTAIGLVVLAVAARMGWSGRASGPQPVPGSAVDAALTAVGGVALCLTGLSGVDWALGLVLLVVLALVVLDHHRRHRPRHRR